MGDNENTVYSRRESPLVSIIIPTYNRAEKLINRSLPSALSQTYKNIEIMVIGDGTDKATEDVMESIYNNRVFFINLSRAEYPNNPRAFWQVGGVPPLNWGLDHAQGKWVTMMGDDDELYPDYIETLLYAAIDQDVDYMYGRVEIRDESRVYGFIGEWPPQSSKMGNGLWKASLPYRYNPNSWQKDMPCDWEFIVQLIDNKVKIGFISKILYKYYPSSGIIPICSPS